MGKIKKLFHGRGNNSAGKQDRGRKKDTGRVSAGISFRMLLCLFPAETGGQVIRINRFEQECCAQVDNGADSDTNHYQQQLL